MVFGSQAASTSKHRIINLDRSPVREANVAELKWGREKREELRCQRQSWESQDDYKPACLSEARGASEEEWKCNLDQEIREGQGRKSQSRDEFGLRLGKPKKNECGLRSSLPALSSVILGELQSLKQRLYFLVSSRGKRWVRELTEDQMVQVAIGRVYKDAVLGPTWDGSLTTLIRAYFRDTFVVVPGSEGRIELVPEFKGKEDEASWDELKRAIVETLIKLSRGGEYDKYGVPLTIVKQAVIRTQGLINWHSLGFSSFLETVRQIGSVCVLYKTMVSGGDWMCTFTPDLNWCRELEDFLDLVTNYVGSRVPDLRLEWIRRACRNHGPLGCDVLSFEKMLGMCEDCIVLDGAVYRLSLALGSALRDQLDEISQSSYRFHLSELLSRPQVMRCLQARMEIEPLHAEDLDLWERSLPLLGHLSPENAKRGVLLAKALASERFPVRGARLLQSDEAVLVDSYGVPAEAAPPKKSKQRVEVTSGAVGRNTDEFRSAWLKFRQIRQKGEQDRFEPKFTCRNAESLEREQVGVSKLKSGCKEKLEIPRRMSRDIQSCLKREIENFQRTGSPRTSFLMCEAGSDNRGFLRGQTSPPQMEFRKAFDSFYSDVNEGPRLKRNAPRSADEVALTVVNPDPADLYIASSPSFPLRSHHHYPLERIGEESGKNRTQNISKLDPAEKTRSKELNTKNGASGSCRGLLTQHLDLLMGNLGTQSMRYENGKKLYESDFQEGDVKAGVNASPGKGGEEFRAGGGVHTQERSPLRKNFWAIYPEQKDGCEVRGPEAVSLLRSSNDNMVADSPLKSKFVSQGDSPSKFQKPLLGMQPRSLTFARGNVSGYLLQAPKIDPLRKQVQSKRKALRLTAVKNKQSGYIYESNAAQPPRLSLLNEGQRPAGAEVEKLRPSFSVQRETDLDGRQAPLKVPERLRMAESPDSPQFHSCLGSQGEERVEKSKPLELSNEKDEKEVILALVREIGVAPDKEDLSGLSDGESFSLNALDEASKRGLLEAIAEVERQQNSVAVQSQGPMINPPPVNARKISHDNIKKNSKPPPTYRLPSNPTLPNQFKGPYDNFSNVNPRAFPPVAPHAMHHPLFNELLYGGFPPVGPDGMPLPSGFNGFDRRARSGSVGSLPQMHPAMLYYILYSLPYALGMQNFPHPSVPPEGFPELHGHDAMGHQFGYPPAGDPNFYGNYWAGHDQRYYQSYQPGQPFYPREMRQAGLTEEKLLPAELGSAANTGNQVGVDTSVKVEESQKPEKIEAVQMVEPEEGGSSSSWNIVEVVEEASKEGASCPAVASQQDVQALVEEVVSCIIAATEKGGAKASAEPAEGASPPAKDLSPVEPSPDVKETEELENLNAKAAELPAAPDARRDSRPSVELPPTAQQAVSRPCKRGSSTLSEFPDFERDDVSAVEHLLLPVQLLD